MAKQKITFQCTECGYKSLKWLGRCPECNQWETLQEVLANASHQLEAMLGPAASRSTTMVPLSSISGKTKERLLADVGEWDRVMGGGIMPSSLIVLTGDPGIGKSTLLLQIAHHLARTQRVFYFSTEESLYQVKQRASRLNCLTYEILFSDMADLAAIITIAHAEKPDLIIIDSIQNCYLSETHTVPGSVAQLRESTFQLMRLAKQHDITVLLTGHITKEGMIAGPKTLEHMVDAVFYLTGDDRWHSRVLRAVKNRFGTINELGFFEMKEDGMIEVPNINEYVLSDVSHSPGSALVSVMEGSRPLLLELQALTIQSKMGIPQRVVSGMDQKQVVLIAAILEKYLQVRLSAQDIFFKVSGGSKIKESGTDLGIALALLSSYFQQALPERSLALGEISLTGQIKPINHISTFVREAQKFGMQQLYVATPQKIEHCTIKTKRFQNVFELLSLFSSE
jgi:DNA repair protein RadA/Sms